MNAFDMLSEDVDFATTSLCEDFLVSPRHSCVREQTRKVHAYQALAERRRAREMLTLGNQMRASVVESQKCRIHRR
eukprot:102186-Pleurochrysis_carterae.AAC.1